MTHFFLIRHGETDWNMQGRWQGHTDIPLNAIGQAQAQRLAERLRNEGASFDIIYSSDLLRAWETASIVGAALDLEPQPLLALREIDVGGWSGLTHAEVRTHNPDLLARLESGEDIQRGGTGERFADLYRRVVEAAERLAAERSNGRLMLVTHGGPVRALLLHAARDKADALPRPLHIGNTSLSVLRNGQTEWTLEIINDMRHLVGGAQARDLMSAPPDDAQQP
jgi:broad specificity phosphatase PhoE